VRPRTHNVIFAVFAVVLFVGSSTSWAQTPPQSDEVSRLKQQGNDAMATFRPADALAAYEKAYAISKEPALLYNMGHALEGLGDFPSALAKYEEFARIAPPELKERVPKLNELLADTRQKVSVVSISCNVLGARVFVRDKSIGEISSSGTLTQTLNSGPATIEIAYEGYATIKQKVLFDKGARSSFDYTLVAKDKAGVLSVQTTPPGDVFVDNKPLGRAPAEGTVVAGEHRIVIRRAGFDDVVTAAVVEVGQRKELSINLEQKPAITTRWWFWTGLGIVVAGGVILTVALLTERSPDSGTIKPGQSQAPLLRF
jgi:hypothetical protein